LSIAEGFFCTAVDDDPAAAKIPPNRPQTATLKNATNQSRQRGPRGRAGFKGVGETGVYLGT